MKKRAAILTRVSTREQKTDRTSLSTQVRACREHAARNGYEVAEHLIISEDHTGTDLQRPGLVRILEAANQHMFDVLILYTYDRLYRPENEGDEWKIFPVIEQLKDCGVSLEFADGSAPTSGPFARCTPCSKAGVPGRSEGNSSSARNAAGERRSPKASSWDARRLDTARTNQGGSPSTLTRR